jgi:hypothetical protein
MLWQKHCRDWWLCTAVVTVVLGIFVWSLSDDFRLVYTIVGLCLLGGIVGSAVSRHQQTHRVSDYTAWTDYLDAYNLFYEMHPRVIILHPFGDGHDHQALRRWEDDGGTPHRDPYILLYFTDDGEFRGLSVRCPST